MAAHGGAQGPRIAGTRSGHDFNPVLPDRTRTFQRVIRDLSEKKLRGALDLDVIRSAAVERGLVRSGHGSTLAWISDIRKYCSHFVLASGLDPPRVQMDHCGCGSTESRETNPPFLRTSSFARI